MKMLKKEEYKSSCFCKLLPKLRHFPRRQNSASCDSQYTDTCSLLNSASIYQINTTKGHKLCYQITGFHSSLYIYYFWMSAEELIISHKIVLGSSATATFLSSCDSIHPTSGKLRMVMIPVLVSSGCHNKLAQSGWFKQKSGVWKV